MGPKMSTKVASECRHTERRRKGLFTLRISVNADTLDPFGIEPTFVANHLGVLMGPSPMMQEWTQRRRSVNGP